MCLWWDIYFKTKSRWFDLGLSENGGYLQIVIFIYFSFSGDICSITNYINHVFVNIRKMRLKESSFGVPIFRSPMVPQLLQFLHLTHQSAQSPSIDIPAPIYIICPKRSQFLLQTIPMPHKGGNLNVSDTPWGPPMLMNPHIMSYHLVLFIYIYNINNIYIYHIPLRLLDPYHIFLI